MPTDGSSKGNDPSSRDAPINGLGMLAEVGLPIGLRAPGAARLVVTTCLSGLVAPHILADVELLVSELVTNSVRHGRLRDHDTVLVRVYVASDVLRVEIDDPGSTGNVARHRPDREAGRGGFGLNLVDLLAASWGVSRNHRTNVWFETSRV
jgi:anti-sigma regulatory factor (Ser/Thr protein kinase)